MWSLSITPVSDSSRFVIHYYSNDDGQGTSGWVFHSVFVDNTYQQGSFRYVRNTSEEPFQQHIIAVYTNTSTATKTIDFRYASTANIYIVLNRTINYTSGFSQKLCRAVVYEIQD